MLYGIFWIVCIVAVGILVGKAIKFGMGPPPVPSEFAPEAPAIPKPIRKEMSVKDRLARSGGLRQRRARWEHARKAGMN